MFLLKQEEDCIFCQIARKRSPAVIYAETDFGMAIKDAQSDDILLIPKKHIECTPKSLAAVAGLLLQLPILMGLKKFEVIIHIGWHVSIDHLHIRIRPK